MKNTLLTSSFLLCVSLFQTSYAASLPSEKDVDGILKLCAIGKVEAIEGEVKGKIDFWKKGIEGTGRGSISDLGGLLGTVPSGKIDPEVQRNYNDCIIRTIRAFTGGNEIVIRNSTVLNNQDSPTLVLKSFPEDKDFIKYGIEPENYLGLAEVGTEVEVLEERETKHPLMKASKVRILSGRLKNQTGWVSSNTVRLVQLLGDRKSP